LLFSQTATTANAGYWEQDDHHHRYDQVPIAIGIIIDNIMDSIGDTSIIVGSRDKYIQK